MGKPFNPTGPKATHVRRLFKHPAQYANTHIAGLVGCSLSYVRQIRVADKLRAPCIRKSLTISGLSRQNYDWLLKECTRGDVTIMAMVDAVITDARLEDQDAKT